MARKAQVVPLVGVVRQSGNKKDRIAGTKDAKHIYYFGGRMGKLVFKLFFRRGKLILINSNIKKGITLTKYKDKDAWYGNTPAGNRVHVQLRKIIGELKWIATS